MTNSPTFGPLSLTVATTGHRELHPDDIAGLEKRVAAFFQSLQEKHPYTRIRLLSALAEGADRLVARVAHRLGIALIVPLPLPLEDYERDFHTKESKEEMRDLFSLAERTFVVPGSGGNRKDAYRRLGEWIARHSEIILALWDGCRNGKAGGTADVVDLKLDGSRDLRRRGQPLDPADTGPVMVIHTRRTMDPPLRRTDDWEYPPNYGPREMAEKTFERIFSRTDELNADIMAVGPRLSAERLDSRQRLLGSQAVHDATLDPVIDLYANTDTLATYFQRRTLLAMRALFVLVFAAVVSFACFAHHVLHEAGEKPLLLLYLLPLFGALWLYQHVERKRYQDRYLDYRALAEGLRVLFYWRIAGLRESVSDRYLNHQRDELDWIRNALRTSELASHEYVAPAGRNGLDAALAQWIDQEVGFFDDRIKREQGLLHRAEQVIDSLIAAGAIATIAYEFALIFLHPETRKELREWMMVLIAVPAASAALYRGYVETRAFAIHVKRYNRMQVLFLNAAKRLREHLEAGNARAARNVVLTLGAAALEENGDWVILHRDRPLEVPQAG